MGIVPSLTKKGAHVLLPTDTGIAHSQTKEGAPVPLPKYVEIVSSQMKEDVFVLLMHTQLYVVHNKIKNELIPRESTQTP